MKVQIDFETRSEAVLNSKRKDNNGTWAYAEHPSTKILCLHYEIDGGGVKRWLPSEPFPPELIEAAKASVMIEAYSDAFNEAVVTGATFEAHKADFEKAIWSYQLTAKLGIPYPQVWACTLAVCAHRALPQALDNAGAVLNLPIQKDERGKYLIKRLCKRHKPSKKWPTGWVDDPDLLAELYDYGATDIEAMGILGHTLGPLPAAEYALWALDQKINERGIQIDLTAVDAAKGLAEEITIELNAELKDLTSGALETAGQVAVLGAWCVEQGEPIPDMQADTIKKWLADPTTAPQVRRALEIRQQVSKTSVKKLNALLRHVSSDGRLRGSLQYHGASTGRWAGRGPQPHNLPRPSVDNLNMDALIACILKRDANELAEQYGDPMTALSDALRGMFTAGPGKTLQTADFTAIEGRGTAWVAGEEWKLEAFRRGEDIYCSTASMVFGYPVIDKKSHPRERGVGKICELAFGYQGAVGAWRGFDKSDKYTDAEVHSYCRAWRAKHPATVALWRGLERTAGRAVMTGKPQHYSCVTYETVVDRAGKWLTCILPNGRRLWYYDPECDVEDTPWGPRYRVTYAGRNNHKGGKWDRIAGYGGLWTENVVQAISRDVLVEAMFRVEYGSYPIVLTIHDDVVSEIAPDFGSQKEFDALMTKVPAWSPGFPIDVAGWRGFRLHKD